MRGEDRMPIGDMTQFKMTIREQAASASTVLKILSTWALIIERSVLPKYLPQEEE